MSEAPDFIQNSIADQEVVVHAWYTRWALKRLAQALDRQGNVSGAICIRVLLDESIEPYTRGEKPSIRAHALSIRPRPAKIDAQHE